MKTNQHSLNRFLASLLGSFSLLLASSTPAATLTWDANGNTAPNPSDGSGAWTNATRWWNGTANVTWTAANMAVFGAGTDTGTKYINAGGLPNPAASNLWFKNSGYILTNATPQVVGCSSPTGSTTNLHLRIDSGKTVTIGTNIIIDYTANSGNGLYMGALASAAAPDNAGGTLEIENGGTVRTSTNVAAAANIYIDGAGTVVNVRTGGTLALTSPANGALTLGQSTGGDCTLNVEGGSVGSAGSGSIAGMIIGNVSAGTVNLNSGAIAITNAGANGVVSGYTATGSGTLNLNGGTLTTTAVKRRLGSATFNFNGGTLKAVANTTAFMTGLTSATVYSGGAIIDDGGFAITIAQDLWDGGGGLTKLGAGTLTLTGANSYSGTTTVSNGTLLATSLGSGSVDVKAGARLGAGSANTVATLALSGNLVLANSVLLFDITNRLNGDKITVAGDLTPMGVTTITLPNLTPLANGNYTLLEVTGTLGGSAANFTVASQSPKTYAIIYQAGFPNQVLLQVTGPVAPGIKSWAGDGVANQWNVNNGLDWVEPNGGVVPFVFLDNDTVVFDDFSANLTVDISAVVSPASVTFNSVNSYTFSGLGGIAGPTSLVKKGTGKLTIATANSYSGGTTLQGATGTALILANSAALGSGTLALQSTTTTADTTVMLDGDLTVTNSIVMDSTTGREAIYATNGNNPKLTGPITITAGASHLYFQNNGLAGSVFALSNSISGPSHTGGVSFRGLAGNFGVVAGQVTLNGVFQLNGAATWTVTSTNNSWTTTIIQGANGGFTLGANDALATGARLNFGNDTSGALDMAGYNQTVAGLDITTTANTPTVGNSSTVNDSLLRINGGGYTFAGQLVDVLGPGTKTLAVELLGGIQILKGNNTYTGPTTISGGTLQVNGSLAAGSAVTVKTNATLAGSGTVSGHVTVNRGGSLTAGSAGSGILTLGSLTLGAAGGDTQTINVTVANTISVLGGLTNNGMTTIRVSSASGYSPGTYPLITYTGDTITNGFVLGLLPVRTEATLQYNTSSIDMVITSVVNDAPKWTGAASGMWDTSTTNWILISGGTPTTYYDGAPGDAVLFDDTLTANPAITLNTTVSPNGVTFGNATTAYSVSGTGSIAGTGGLTKTGTNTTTLSTSNSFTGAVAVGGRLVIKKSTALGSGTKTIGVRSTVGLFAELHLDGSLGPVVLPAEFTFNNYGDVSYAGNIVNDAGNNIVNGALYAVTGGGHPKYAVNAGSLTLNGTVGITATSGSAKILQLAGTRAGTGTVAGVVQNHLTATRITYVSVLGGTWTLSNPNNTFTGQTVVYTNSTLIVSGKIPASGYGGVVVANGGTLAGTGSILAETVIQAGGVLSPGPSVGTLALNNNLTLQGTVVMEIGRNGAALTNDLVAGISTVTYGGTLMVTNIGGSALQVGDSFRLFAATNYASAFASIVYPAGYTFTDNLATSGTITVLTAPVTTPPTLTYVPSGDNWVFTWASGGFKLQTQTNSLTVGLGTNWVDVAGGNTSGVSVPAPIAGNPAVFFRLISTL